MARAVTTWLGLLCLATATQADIAKYDVTRTDAPPTLDGRLDDACWKTACVVDTFTLLGKGDDPGVTTRAFLTYDADHLFLAFDCQEPLGAKLTADATEHDAPTWKDDCVEIFLNPSGDRRRYVQLAINTAGVIMDNYAAEPGGKLDLGYDTGAEAKAQVGAGRWTLELRVPFTTLPLGSPTADWTFHLARNRKVATQLLTCLRSPVSGFHEIAKFDVLRGISLPEQPVSIEALSFGERLQGENVCRATLRNWTAARVEATLSTAIDGNRRQSTCTLDPNSETQAEVSYYLSPADAGKRLQVELQITGKVVQRRSTSIDTVPPILGGLPMAAHYLSPTDFVRLELPIQLAERSRRSAQLHWTAAAPDGTQVGAGMTTVAKTPAVVRLFWQHWRPGKYQLALRLTQDGKQMAQTEETVRLVPSPWGSE